METDLGLVGGVLVGFFIYLLLLVVYLFVSHLRARQRVRAAKAARAAKTARAEAAMAARSGHRSSQKPPQDATTPSERGDQDPAAEGSTTLSSRLKGETVEPAASESKAADSELISAPPIEPSGDDLPSKGSSPPASPSSTAPTASTTDGDQSDIAPSAPTPVPGSEPPGQNGGSPQPPPSSTPPPMLGKPKSSGQIIANSVMGFFGGRQPYQPYAPNAGRVYPAAQPATPSQYAQSLVNPPQYANPNHNPHTGARPWQPPQQPYFSRPNEAKEEEDEDLEEAEDEADYQAYFGYQKRRYQSKEQQRRPVGYHPSQQVGGGSVVHGSYSYGQGSYASYQSAASFNPPSYQSAASSTAGGAYGPQSYGSYASFSAQPTANTHNGAGAAAGVPPYAGSAAQAEGGGGDGEEGDY